MCISQSFFQVLMMQTCAMQNSHMYAQILLLKITPNNSLMFSQKVQVNRNKKVID